MKITLFLGAGFSVPFGLPAMNGFLGFADSSGRVSREEKDFLNELVLEARGANSFLESSPTNLEDILSFSEMGDRLNLNREPRRADRLREIIRKIYTTSPHPRDYWGRFDALERLLGLKPWEEEDKLTIITTNYDLNAESACIKLKRKAKLNVPMEDLNHEGTSVVAGHLYGDDGIPLFKLHGSVNWYAGANGEIRVENRVVQINNHEDNRYLSLPFSCVDQYKSPTAPIIVPPSFLKPELSDALQTVWSGAARALSKANVVVFIGYSFPQSDTEMMYFLARAFSGNPGLRRIFVVDPKADAIVNRLKTNGSKIGSHFRELLEPLANSWTKVSVPVEAV